jgi:HPt (histidine-containing phosphotransfer) domain-containing protein
MVAPLDPQRLAELEHILGPDFGSILDSLEHSIASAIDDAEAALAAGDLAATAYAAHACRNDALMVGASELQKDLSALEDAARGGELESARSTLARVRGQWPAAREELGRTARRNASA